MRKEQGRDDDDDDDDDDDLSIYLSIDLSIIGLRLLSEERNGPRLKAGGTATQSPPKKESRKKPKTRGGRSLSESLSFCSLCA